jgi:hypothetical protein
MCCGLLFGLLIIGCGPAAPKREYADVAGKVSYKGVPLKMGTVMFQPSSGPLVAGEIQSDGTYSLKGEIGENLVMITSSEAVDPAIAGDPEKLKAAKPPKSHIPDHYGMSLSGLKFDVKAGQNKADFDLP